MDPIKEIVGHQVKRTFGVVTTLAIVGSVGFILWSIYAGVIKPVVNPETTTDQHAEQINNPTYSPQPHPLGCSNMRVYEMYRKKQ